MRPHNRWANRRRLGLISEWYGTSATFSTLCSRLVLPSEDRTNSKDILRIN
jgi:hypothetical protein